MTVLATFVPAVTASATPGARLQHARLANHLTTNPQPPATPDPVAEPAIAEGLAGGLDSVACASSTSCEAVGFQGAYGGLSQSSLGQIVSIDNGTFGQVHDLSDAGTMLSVACPTTTDCYAVGVDLYTDPVTQVLEEVPAFLPIVHGSPGTPTNILVPDDGTPTEAPGQMTGISCQSTSSCVTVGYTYDGDRPFVIPISNGSLGAVTYLPAVDGGFGNVTAVSCDATQCLAVGTLNNEGMYVDVAGGHVGTQMTVSGTQNFTGVTCAAGDCVAVGYESAGPPAAVDIDKGVAGTPEYGTNDVVQQSFVSVACAPVANGLGTCMTGGEGTSLSDNTGDLTALGTSTDLLSKPSTAIAPGDWIVDGLTCPEAGACIGVGWSTLGQAEMSPVCTYQGTGTSTTASERLTGAEPLTAAGGTPCSVNVFVTAVDGLPKVGGLEAGLDYAKPHAAFTGESALDGRGGHISNSCFGGCLDLKVTSLVLSDKGTIIAVPNADVSAYLSAGIAPDDIPSYPKGAPAPGNGLLCELKAVRSSVGAPTVEGFDSTSNCSKTVLKGLTTDKYGTAFIRLWVPGLIADASTTVIANVKQSCGASTCLKFGEQSGTGNMALHIEARVDYDDTTTLSHEAVEQFIELARNTAPAQFAKIVGKAAAKIIFLALLGEEAAVLGEKFVHELLEEAVTDTGKEIWEYMELEALFMGTVFRVPDAGLEANPKSVVGLLDSKFRNTVVGMLKNFGLQLLSLERTHGGKVPTQTISLRVYEVSYCDPSHTDDCGPGYDAATTGIKSFLYFRFHSQSSAESNTFTSDFVTPYNATSWMEARFGT